MVVSDNGGTWSVPLSSVGEVICGLDGGRKERADVGQPRSAKSKIAFWRIRRRMNVSTSNPFHGSSWNVTEHLKSAL